MKLLGLLGGVSWQSTAIYYRLLNEGAQKRLGGFHSAQLLLWSFDFAETTRLKTDGNWAGLAKMAADAASRLEMAGARGLVICSNTMHKIAPEVEAAVKIPLIHIVDATAEVIDATASRRPILLGTRYTMEEDFIKDHLRTRYGIDAIVPDEECRTRIHRIIFDELCEGIVKPDSKKAILAACEDLRKRGADGVILGCTELTMMISQDDLDLTLFDTTAIHAAAALEFALQK